MQPDHNVGFEGVAGEVGGGSADTEGLESAAPVVRVAKSGWAGTSLHRPSAFVLPETDDVISVAFAGNGHAERNCSAILASFN